MRFSGKSAIVTGGATGIGAATAKKLHAEGADVMFVYSRNVTAADNLIAECKDEGPGKFIGLKADLRKEEECIRMAEEAAREFGKIDILVCSAGTVGPYYRPHELPLDVYDNTMNINERGVFMSCKAVIPYMIENGGGAIVNVSSTAGLKPDMINMGYCSSKHACIGITKQLSFEYGPKEHIRVNAVCPGTTDTQLVQHFVHDPGYLQTVAGTPAGRVAEPIDIANVICFLASDEAAMIHGVALPVDGGYLIKNM